MRLFYAVKLDDTMQKQINATVRTLRRFCQKGNFTQAGHFHITLLFLGEIPADALEKAAGALEDTEGKPFEATIEGLGAFMRPGGDVYWMDVHPKEPFIITHDLLCRHLSARGIAVKNETFRPHITLGRQIILQPDYHRETILKKNPGRFAFWVGGITLMQSERINGELVYTPLYDKIWKA
ncbi:MAG: RNA 2',3'-cyclic phosphodiesterase [Christensenellales bacterium]